MAPPENNKVSLRRTKVIDPESSCQTYPFQESSKYTSAKKLGLKFVIFCFEILLVLAKIE
jgi:hypothetical protein